MKTFKIYVTTPGEARDEKNPHRPGQLYYEWEYYNRTTPAYTPTCEKLGLGEWDAVEVWQIRFRYRYNYGQFKLWIDISKDQFDNRQQIGITYFETRRIFRAVIPQTTTTEEKCIGCKCDRGSCKGSCSSDLIIAEKILARHINKHSLLSVGCISDIISAMQEYRNQPVSKDSWIRVEYGLPEQSGKYNVVIQNGSDSFVDTVMFAKPWKTWNLYGSLITHWQPLPTPPTKNQQTTN
ncbi:hypothetical protein A0256_23180 [Mucilaginibacter sp. PAMC 26640]|nr:hypothetical protein A0256_23180 [Mucilaginibacter sp. PAMC 26640]